MKHAQLCKELEDCLKALNGQHVSRFVEVDQKLKDISTLGRELEGQLQVMVN